MGNKTSKCEDVIGITWQARSVTEPRSISTSDYEEMRRTQAQVQIRDNVTPILSSAVVLEANERAQERHTITLPGDSLKNEHEALEIGNQRAEVRPSSTGSFLFIYSWRQLKEFPMLDLEYLASHEKMSLLDLSNNYMRGL